MLNPINKYLKTKKKAAARLTINWETAAFGCYTGCLMILLYSSFSKSGIDIEIKEKKQVLTPSRVSSLGIYFISMRFKVFMLY